MILKISDGNGGYHWFDEVFKPHVSLQKNEISKHEDLLELQKKLDDERRGKVCNLVAMEDVIYNLPLKVAIVEFERENNKYRVIFTDKCYICNNAGDTVESIRVQ